MDFIRATGNPGGSGFIPLAAPKAPAGEGDAAKSGHQVVEQRRGVTVRRHKLLDD